MLYLKSYTDQYVVETISSNHANRFRYVDTISDDELKQWEKYVCFESVEDIENNIVIVMEALDIIDNINYFDIDDRFEEIN